MRGVFRWANSFGVPCCGGQRRCMPVTVVARAKAARGANRYLVSAPRGGPRNTWVRFEDGYEAIVSWRAVGREPIAASSPFP